MMNLYFEISECITDAPHRYLAAYDVKPAAMGLKLPSRYMSIAMDSDRIWCEDEHSRVHFIKHRWKDCTQAPVDTKEFFWVKLRSVKV